MKPQQLLQWMAVVAIATAILTACQRQGDEHAGSDSQSAQQHAAAPAGLWLR
ncbi:hypothetical protein ACS5PN_07785 [Roseateles sp. NT4]|uniref:hypothetical protein n=1 Tax=Roseateles sp. NT4 TaxID=3453715 RepID=UPI003EE8CC42